MAERNVSVRLSANVSAYQKAMGDASASTKKLQQEAGRDMAQLGGKMQDVGKMATVGITLPLIGIGAGAVAMSNNFNASMSKIVGLVGLSTDEVDGMKESVLGLAGETARSPQELADALFVVTSAGLRGEEALSALEMSAKGSAAGMGDTGDIARAVASAMNAYGSDVVSAAEATDILTATARAGNFETSELAGSLGRVLPFAKQAQVSFEDVGGAIALLTRSGVSASESVTQVQALMRSIVVPTREAETIFGELGMTAEDVRDSMGENGLVDTINMLDTKLGGNREQLGRLIGSAEGASVAFQILDADAESLEGTFGVTANAAGLIDEAFNAMSETDQFKMQQAIEDLAVAMVQVGSIIAPIVADIAGGIADMAGAFSDLDPTLQKIIIGIAGAAAAAGPLLIVTGSLVKNYALLKTAMAGSNATMAGSAAAMTRVATAAAIAGAAYGSFKSVNAGLKGDMEWLYDDVSIFEKPFQAIGKGMFWIAGGSKPAAIGMRELDESAQEMYGTMTSGVFTMDQLTSRLKDQGVEQEVANRIIIAFRKQLDLQTEAEENLAEATEDTTEATDDQAEATQTASEKLSDYRKRTNDAEGALDGAYDAGVDVNQMLADQRERAEQAAGEIQTLADEFGWLLNKMSDRGKFLDAQDGFDAVQAAAEDAYTAAAEGSEDAERKSRDHERAVNALKEDVIEYADEVGNIPAEQVSEIVALIDQGALAEAEAALERLERNRTVSYNAVVYARAGGSYGDALKFGGPLADGGPTYPNTIHEVNENGSELFTENGRTYLMSSTNGFVTPTAAAPPATSAADTGTRIGVNVEKLIDRSGHSLEDVFRAANAHLALGV